MSILALNPGAYYHLESLEGERYAGYFDRVIRPEELDTVDLADFNVVVVPCRTPADRMEPHAAKLRAYLDNGGTIVATGESHSELWLPGVKFMSQPINFWWWLTPGADLGVRVVKPEHSLFGYLTEKDCTYHLHGFFDVPAGAEVLVVNESQKPILYVDEVTTKGRMVLTTLDPFYHHGSHFMPATTRFLDGFLPWVREVLDEGKPGRNRMAPELVVLDGGKPISFTFADLMRYHGHGFPGGVAHAFAAMRSAFPRLDGGRPLERREVIVRTAFKGPGGHDALEMVTRGRSEGRQHIVPELGEPERGMTLQNYVWEFTYRGTTATVHVSEGIVRDEFVELGRKTDRTPEEEARLEWHKSDMAQRILALPPESVYPALS